MFVFSFLPFHLCDKEMDMSEFCGLREQILLQYEMVKSKGNWVQMIVRSAQNEWIHSGSVINLGVYCMMLDDSRMWVRSVRTTATYTKNLCSEKRLRSDRVAASAWCFDMASKTIEMIDSICNEIDCASNMMRPLLAENQ